MIGLEKKKILAAKIFGVGKKRILFNPARLAEINEAITKQDIRDLYSDGAIIIRDIKGRKKKTRRKTKRGMGKIKLKRKDGKRNYIILTRKLRRYIKELKKQGKLNAEKYSDIAKKIKAKMFKDKSHLKEHLKEEGIA